jgi:hypothetical protein
MEQGNLWQKLKIKEKTTTPSEAATMGSAIVKCRAGRADRGAPTEMAWADRLAIEARRNRCVIEAATVEAADMITEKDWGTERSIIM